MFATVSDRLTLRFQTVVDGRYDSMSVYTYFAAAPTEHDLSTPQQ
jgi:hypothetical protein